MTKLPPVWPETVLDCWVQANYDWMRRVLIYK